MPSVMERSGAGVLSRSRAKTVTNGNSQPHSEEESSDEEHAHGETRIQHGAGKGSASETKAQMFIFLSSDLNFSWFPDFWLHQALGMLLWHKHDVERSLADLANFTPFPDEWTVEDKVLFEQAFSFHGKSFHRIQQMLPDKLISSLVKYYYSWKKTRTRTSVMDRQARRLINKREKDDSNDEIEEGEQASDSDFEIDAKKEAAKQNASSTSSDKATPSRSGPVKKENIGAQYRHHPLRARRRPPKGMHLEQADIMSLSASHDAGVLTIRQLDTQLVSLKRQVPGFSVWISASLCPHSLPRQLSISPRLAQVSSFFVSYRRRFNLDEVLREWAAEQVATSRDQRDPRRSGEEMATATDGGVEEEEVRTVNTQKVVSL
uniref:REST corepressor 2 n=1 Tax=Neolamprologus brichardi TaxID=32507 RepID=A0A3Q4ME41_NEOBR